MKNSDLIIGVIARMLDGEPAPGFQTPEFAQLIAAATQLEGGHPGDDFHTLGTRTLHLLMERIHGAMTAEREITLMRDNSKPLC